LAAIEREGGNVPDGVAEPAATHGRS
jgi:hypothetical protein